MDYLNLKLQMKGVLKWALPMVQPSNINASFLRKMKKNTINLTTQEAFNTTEANSQIKGTKPKCARQRLPLKHMTKLMNNNQINRSAPHNSKVHNGSLNNPHSKRDSSKRMHMRYQQQQLLRDYSRIKTLFCSHRVFCLNLKARAARAAVDS